METAASIYTGIIFPDTASKAAPHLSDLQKAMLDAAPDCIKVISLDGRLLMMNRAGCRALNLAENSRFGMSWIGLLSEDVHPRGIEALRKAAAGQNARFPGKSVSHDVISYWDNLLTPVANSSGEVIVVLCISRDVTEKTLLEMRLEEAVDREKLLSREMQHRVKNLLAVVSGLIFIAEKEADSADASSSATTILREKLDALSRASDAAFVQDEGTETTASYTDLETLVRSVLKPYGDRCRASGSAVSLRRNVITSLALFLHELATNSIKYGALQKDGGNVAIQWMSNGDILDLTWIETGGTPVSASPDRIGFGSEMVDRIVRSAGGTINRAWHPDGLVVDIHLPNALCG